jgi:hypothetical protein
VSDGDLLTAMRDLVQEDVGGRGLRTDPDDNLITACPGDFAAACRSIAETPRPVLAVVTGFFIAHADPPCGETDGPLGAVFLARALAPLGIQLLLVTDTVNRAALEAGLAVAGLDKVPPVLAYRTEVKPEWFQQVWDGRRSWVGNPSVIGDLTHLIALERVGPNHTSRSLKRQLHGSTDVLDDFRREVPPRERDRCFNMRCRDITADTAALWGLFEESPARDGLTTIGIGDGGNEIGMGKIPWDTVRRNIPNGARIACRVPTDHLIVAGVSNWGAYALAAGVRLLRGAPHDPGLCDPDRERELLQLMVERGPLVDGTTGKRIEQVDGLPWDRYASVLVRLGEMLATRS